MIDIEGLEECSKFEMHDVLVRTSDIIAFTGFVWETNDPLEQRDTAIFAHYPNDDGPEEEKWAFRYLGETTGIHGCAVFDPDERWAFLADDGEVYVTGGDVDDWEEPISQPGSVYFSNLKCVKNGKAYAVGPNRVVYKRLAPGKWQRLGKGLLPQGKDTNLKNSGFSDIDGFGEDDLYACGGNGDLWRFDGDLWHQEDVPTNARLKNICCDDSGNIYVTTNRNEIVMGSDGAWELLSHDITTEAFESIVLFDGRVIVSTISKLLVVDNSEIKLWEVDPPGLPSFAHLAAGDGILVVMGRDRAALYNGANWQKVL